MKLNFAVEQFEDIEDEIYTMSSDHWEEVEVFQEEAPYDVDSETYHRLSNMGLLVCVTAREKKELVGYAIFTISTQLHSKHTVVAQNTALYLKPDYRATQASTHLLLQAEEFLAEQGVNVMTVSVKDKRDFSSLLKFLKYGKVETVYAKALKSPEE